MVKLSCRINGHPRPNVTWTKDGETNISRAQVTNNGQTLAIQSVLPTDGGVYKCIASNQFGESSTSTTLTVAGKRHSVLENCTVSFITTGHRYDRNSFAS